LTSPQWVKWLPSFLKNRLEGRHELQKELTNTGWMFFDKLLRMAAGLLIGVAVARYLGPDGYGLLSFAGSYVMLFSALALFGLESLVVRELVTHPAERSSILGTAFSIRMLAGIVSVPLCLAALLFIRPDDRIMLVMVALLSSALVFQAFDVIDLWFQSRVATRNVVLVRMVAFSISAAAKLACVLYAGSISAVVVATAIEALLAACGLIVVYKMAGERLLDWRFSATQFRRLVTAALPMMLSGIVLMIYLRIDQVMLGAMAPQQEVGLYAAAVRISEIWYFVPAAIVSSVFPGIVSLKNNSPDAFSLRIQQLYKLMTFMGYVIAISVTLLAPWIIQLLFGASYAPAAPLLAILIWAGLFANITVARNAHLIALDRGQALLWCTSAGAASNILLNLLLIPPYGATGAAVSTCLSYWVAAHGACFFSATLRPVAWMITKSLIYPRWW